MSARVTREIRYTILTIRTRVSMASSLSPANESNERDGTLGHSWWTKHGRRREKQIQIAREREKEASHSFLRKLSPVRAARYRCGFKNPSANTKRDVISWIGSWNFTNVKGPKRWSFKAPISSDGVYIIIETRITFDSSSVLQLWSLIEEPLISRELLIGVISQLTMLRDVN